METTIPTNVNEKPDLIMFDDALNHPQYQDAMKKFQDMYIQMRVIDVSLETLGKIVDTVSAKCNFKVKYDFQFSAGLKSGTCKIILDKTILLGNGSGFYQKKAKEEALLDFHRTCVKDVNVSNQIAETMQCCPPEVSPNDESDYFSEDFEIFELPFLEDFYIRNNRSNIASSVLLEAFQFFKLAIHYADIENKVHLFINDSVLATIPLCDGLSNTKARLSNLVLKHLETTKWTLMRNTLYINQFDDSVDKEGMYDTNLKDYTKIDSALNIGGQLMLKMGWNEDSGLGKTGVGRLDPVINNSNGRREGLGFNFGSSKDMKSFTNNVSQCLRNWIKEDEDDIIFDRNFDNKERAVIHKECRKLGITSKSFNNTNGDRFLVVSKLRSPQELFKWVQSKGGKTKLYTLLPPGFRKSKCD